ncbi:hypothetical protein V5799_024049 [Amblyomma americanum]|uniref:Uncharacterized protein n=1 Tax=Amblyomma americanum TaxID=6943 RepID=A0AAQ4ED84_AMBAM
MLLTGASCEQTAYGCLREATAARFLLIAGANLPKKQPSFPPALLEALLCWKRSAKFRVAGCGIFSLHLCAGCRQYPCRAGA